MTNYYNLAIQNILNKAINRDIKSYRYLIKTACTNLAYVAKQIFINEEVKKIYIHNNVEKCITGKIKTGKYLLAHEYIIVLNYAKHVLKYITNMNNK